MDYADDVATVAGNTKGGGGHTSHMAVGVAVEIGGVAGGAGASRNRANVIPAVPCRQVWRGGVAQAAGVNMHRHWVIGRMASGGSNTGRGVSDMA